MSTGNLSSLALLFPQVQRKQQAFRNDESGKEGLPGRLVYREPLPTLKGAGPFCPSYCPVKDEKQLMTGRTLTLKTHIWERHYVQQWNSWEPEGPALSLNIEVMVKDVVPETNSSWQVPSPPLTVVCSQLSYASHLENRDDNNSIYLTGVWGGLNESMLHRMTPSTE